MLVIRVMAKRVWSWTVEVRVLTTMMGLSAMVRFFGFGGGEWWHVGKRFLRHIGR